MDWIPFHNTLKKEQSLDIKSKTERLFGLFFLLCASLANAQTLHERTVVDALNGEIVPFAVCSVVSGGAGAVGDEWGRVKMVCNENDSIDIQAPGYRDRVRAADILWRIQPMTVTSALETTVVAFRNNRSNMSTPGSIGLISSSLLNATDQTSLQNALNTIPGVQMDSRGYGGSQRINIRGSFLRSPTAVRNIRMYMNGIPLASPDGTAPLELMDAWDIGRMEVIKGPAGSLWGSGTGGVLLISPKKATKNGWNATHQQLHGMFGLQRYTQAVEWKKGNWNMRLSHVYQDNDGNRLQEFNRKHQASLTIHWDASRKLSYFLYATAFTGHLGLPGALTANVAEVNPFAANAFSVANNASLYRTRMLAGVSQTWVVNQKWRNTTSVYAVASDKRNPYGTSAARSGYKDEPSSETGARTEWRGEYRWRDAYITPLLGGEWQLERFRLDEYTLAAGRAGEKKFTQTADYSALMGFAGADIKRGKWLLTIGSSLNRTVHSIGYRSALANFDSTATWSASWLPRIGTSWEAWPNTFFHTSLSRGNSNPTIFEQLDAAYIQGRAQLARRLSPEIGTNYEAGVKGLWKKTGLQYELTYYTFFLRDAILAYTTTLFTDDPISEVVVESYKNAGSTRQQGVELSLIWQKSWEGRWYNEAQFTVAGAWQDYRFMEYTVDEQSLNGKALPGTPRVLWNATFSGKALDGGVKCQVQYYYTGTNFANNDNTTVIAPFSLVNARIESELNAFFYPMIPLSVFFGVNNALNTAYTSFLNLNDANGRHFNPAPGRNFYIGLAVSIK